MNSEELEQSLRAEFENYLNGVLANMREGVTVFQQKIEADVENHKAQIAEAIRGFSEQFNSEHVFDAAFKETVVEHLRLARDDGARITATAIAEAEDLEKASTGNVDLNSLKDAIAEIGSKDSQSAILKSLINHAAEYTPRGAFFIVKNEQFVGWKVFGDESHDSESTIREIHFSVDADTILSNAVTARTLSEGSFGTYTDDGSFLEPLHFGSPDRMYAIPLMARGRGVAVLYADYGREGIAVNTDALEMLVRVAGLTVEMLASVKSARTEGELAPGADFSDTGHEVEDFSETEAQYQSVHAAIEPTLVPDYSESRNDLEEYHESEMPRVLERVEVESKAFFGENNELVADSSNAADHGMAPEYVPESSESDVFSSQSINSSQFENTLPIVDFDTSASLEADSQEVSDEAELNEVSSAEEVAGFEVQGIESGFTEAAIVFDAPAESAPQVLDASPFDQPADRFEPESLIGAPPVSASPVVEKVASPAASSRLSDRHVDLPIEVADEERRLHNDARRFARLLVSEIKLYNEKKVQEGRESRDLYDRLREAIDRSREMYDKRVQQPVADKFDYFHYEVVNALAEGDISCLGTSYPGTT